MGSPVVKAGVIAVPMLAAATYLAYGRGFVNGDMMCALTWGDQLAHLRQPTWPCATPHPLVNLISAVLSPLGLAAEPAWQAIGYLSLGALLYATWLAGATLFGRWAGVLAAGLVATRGTVVAFGPLRTLTSRTRRLSFGRSRSRRGRRVAGRRCLYS